MLKPSGAWTIKIATSMVMIRGIVDSLVPKPINKKIEQKNSAKTVKYNEAVTPTPIGSPNWISPPAVSQPNF